MEALVESISSFPIILGARREVKEESFKLFIYFFAVADGDDDDEEHLFFDPVYDSIVGCPQRTQAGQIIGQRLSFGGI